MVKIKFVIKTIADCLLAGLISVGIFQSIIAIPESMESYSILAVFFIIFCALMVFYSWKFKKEEELVSLIIASVVSIVEVFFIGIALERSLDMIFLVWFITVPSVFVFDKTLG